MLPVLVRNEGEVELAAEEVTIMPKGGVSAFVTALRNVSIKF